MGRSSNLTTIVSIKWRCPLSSLTGRYQDVPQLEKQSERETKIGQLIFSLVETDKHPFPSELCLCLAHGSSLLDAHWCTQLKGQCVVLHAVCNLSPHPSSGRSHAVPFATFISVMGQLLVVLQVKCRWEPFLTALLPALPLCALSILCIPPSKDITETV